MKSPNNIHYMKQNGKFFFIRTFFKTVFILVFIILLCACDKNPVSFRTVSITIPQHPWENGTGVELWYKLKWNEGTQIRTKFIPNTQRVIQLRIPSVHTVLICAYPLESMIPFGTGISAGNQDRYFILNQDDGLLANLLLNTCDPSVLTVNFEKLSRKSLSVSDNFSILNTTILIQDVLNGNLSSKSFQPVETIKLTDLPMYSGLWIPENVHEQPFTVSEDGIVPVLELFPGIHRYLCIKRNLEVHLIVSEDDVFKYEKPTGT